MIRPTASLFIILVAVSLLFAAKGWATPEFPAVLFEQPSHFTAPDGTDVLVAAGTYRVEQSAETQLKLVADLLQPAIEIQATATTHEETLASPLALAITEEGQEDEVHLVLLLPDGRGLDATGSLSDTRSRAVGPLYRGNPLGRVQVQTAVAQSKLPTQRISPYQKTVPLVSPIIVVPRPAAPATNKGRWITWNYLYMHHPQIVAQALAEIQAGKRPLSDMNGLATQPELTEMLKTNWSAEAAQMTAARTAAMSQAGVTTRGGLSRSQASTNLSAALSSAKMPLSPTSEKTALSPTLKFNVLALPPRDLGAAWSGQRNTTIITVTVPFDGYMQPYLNLETTKRRFRIVSATSYTGEIVNGQPVIEQQVRGGNYTDVLPRAQSDATLVSRAGIVTLNVKRGQLVSIEIAFEPDSGYGPPVGNYEVTLEVDGFAQSGARWARTATIRARSLGINFGVLAYAEQGHAETLTNQVVEMPIVITNAAASAWAGTLTPAQLPPGVTMDPLSVSFPGQGTQRHLARFRVSDAAQDGPAQPIVVRVDGAGQTRMVNLSITIYHPLISWHWGLTELIPGIPKDRGPGLLYGCSTGGEVHVGINSLFVSVNDRGRLWWEIDSYNSQSVDIGGTNFSVSLSFNATRDITDLIRGHIGPCTLSQLYSHQIVQPWIRYNLLTIAETGFTFNYVED